MKKMILMPLLIGIFSFSNTAITAIAFIVLHVILLKKILDCVRG